MILTKFAKMWEAMDTNEKDLPDYLLLPYEIRCSCEAGGVVMFMPDQ